MITIKGKYNTAIIMIDYLDEATTSQIYSFLNHPAFAKSHIAIMVDAHKGAGCCIGFTMKMNEYIIPYVIGVDIGCGVIAINIGRQPIDFAALDDFIKKNIPSGFSLRNNRTLAIASAMRTEFGDSVGKIIRNIGLDTSKVERSLGTLGGGNHFIEIDQKEDGTNWLLIHTGSRNFGLQVANYHQKKAKKLIKEMFMGADAYKDLEYLPMKLGGEDYIADMQVAQRYASVNRYEIADILMTGFFKQSNIEVIESIHNYINFDDKIIRKGAVSAHEGERLVIPFNMRDGVAVCVGKGNKKWNYSAPHGAGRILSRRKAKETLSMDEFTNEMKGIYTTTATQNTIDEAPMAYKDMNTIVEAIGETVDIEFFMKPVYNFKAGGE